ncbi:ROK family protein [Aurantiacibacter spongiae]|uniref:ROK family protein n=1 Tax=Aurantiacibacter spongiae TaxID=2488860 RepID=A0A3N5DPU8_9SPHN|nr:ROK family protein [Aurantiacibacter spongiae]RPF71161.1 ROK family protein [Aurantiacibacter spongiae]
MSDEDGLIGAIEAGGTKFVLGLARADGELIDTHRLPTTTPDETFAAMTSWLRAAADRHGRIAALGVASFGPLRTDRSASDWGTITTTPKPHWSGASFARALGPFGVPLAIDTDVTGAALGEWLGGAGAGRGTVVYTTVGTGIGTGVISGGRPLAGSGHYEAGHIRPARGAGDDWPGICPYHGDCLEGLASGPAIMARWEHDLSAGSAQEIGLIADYLAEMHAALVLLHMPDIAILGGGVAKAPGLIEAVRAKTRAKLAGYVESWDTDLGAHIVPPALGDLAGLAGAVELGRQALCESAA